MKYYSPDFKSYVIDDETEKAIRDEQEKIHEKQLQDGYKFWRKHGRIFTYLYLTFLMLAITVFAWEYFVLEKPETISMVMYIAMGLLGVIAYYYQWRVAKKKAPAGDRTE